LAPFADGFAAVLRAQGYTSHGAVKHRHLFASLSRWLEREKLAPVDLNEEVLSRFSRSGELLGGETYRASGLLSRYWRTFAGSAWSGLPARRGVAGLSMICSATTCDTSSSSAGCSPSLRAGTR